MKRMFRLLALTLAVLMFAPALPAVFAAPKKPISRDAQPAMKDVFADYFLLGNIYDNTNNVNKSTTRGALITKHYNVLTGQNCMKPDALSTGNAGTSGTIGGTRFNTADGLMNSAMANGMVVHGHVLVWHGQTPNWLNGGSGSGNGTYTRATAKANMERYIKTVVEHYDDPKWNGTLVSWDVVNEAFTDGVSFPADPAPGAWKNCLRTGSQSGWYRAYGNSVSAGVMNPGEHQSDFIYDAFVLARSYTNAKLYYNDFNLFFDGKARAVAQMVTELNAKYAAEHPEDPRMLIEGVGLQSHNYMFETPAFAKDSVDSVEQGILTLSATGVDLSMSELDLFCFYPWNGEPQGTNGTFIELKNRTAAQLVAQNGTDETKNYWANLGVATGAEVEVHQARRYAEYFEVYKKYANKIERVTFWGVRDNDSWRKNHNPLLFNSDYSPKEAFWAVVDSEGYLSLGNYGAGLVLNSDKSFVSAGQYFNVTASLDPAEPSNAASLVFTYDDSVFEYRGYSAPNGYNILNTVSEPGKVTFILGGMSGYSLSDLGSVMFSARDDVDLAYGDSLIQASVDYVTLINGEKSILGSGSAIYVGTAGGIPGDTNNDGVVDLIDLSNMIDWFGIKAGDALWNTVKYFDFNNNGEIDISDIAFVATLI